MIIDSHQHFWTYSPQSHAWISEEMKVLRRDFHPQDLAPLLQAAQIDGCIAVQAAQTAGETDFLLDLADQHAFILGVVGWVDLRADDLSQRLDRWQERPRLRGFRHIVQDETDPAFLQQSAFQRGLEALAARGYSYDLLIYPHQLPAAIQLVEALPELPIVLDHLAKPAIARQEMQPWRKHLQQLAAFPQVTCKLSGLITEADWQHWTPQDIWPYVEAALAAFGPHRVMFGSDWPVCLLAGTYQRWVQALDQCTSTLSESEKADLWGQTAARFYGLSTGTHAAR